ncbi:MAG TPA: ATPase [Lachnospiraceae bacterium]|nr:ATPase [Lachnospiraceae bacterium]
MGNSRIEQIIEEIEDYIDTCKGTLLSSGEKIIVNRERIEELLRELRMKTPEEIKRYQRVLANKDAIMEDAQQKAQAIIAQANIQNQELINEHEIMQQAYEQANQVIDTATSQAQEILDNATRDANEIRLGAIQYTDELLANLQDMMQRMVETSNLRYEAMMNNFQDFYNVIVSNRAELNPQQPQQETAQPEETQETQE